MSDYYLECSKCESTLDYPDNKSVFYCNCGGSLERKQDTDIAIRQDRPGLWVNEDVIKAYEDELGKFKYWDVNTNNPAIIGEGMEVYVNNKEFEKVRVWDVPNGAISAICMSGGDPHIRDNCSGINYGKSMTSAADERCDVKVEGSVTLYVPPNVLDKLNLQHIRDDITKGVK